MVYIFQDECERSTENESLKECRDEARLNLAENKMVFHEQLRKKEDRIKELEMVIDELQIKNDILNG